MKIHYVTGSRADFGLMLNCLKAIDAHSDHDLGIVITGQHMVAHYGDTAREVRDSGLSIAHEISVQLAGESGAEMARAMANEMSAFVTFWERSRPDLVLVLGDRGEMLAATLAAVHLGVFVAHIHGGERSGTLDESIRHAISKLAHFHLVATADSAERLRRMGELPEAIHIIGAPGLVGVTDKVQRDRGKLSERFRLPTSSNIALVAFHPVVQEADKAREQVETLINAIKLAGLSQIILRPNSDAGGAAIDGYLDSVANEPRIRVETHLDRDSYLEVLASCDVLIGNTSSGIIESASFGTPYVCVGSRQDGRLRNENTIDVPQVATQKILDAIDKALGLNGPFINLYGDGRTDSRLRDILADLDLDPALLKKRNAY